MAERKSVNRYYPPDFDPAKHKSINKYRNSHPLRERAKKLSQGILVIRFEMPYNIWCGGCGNHIGMGVRYNAEKKKVGNYYTTPIYRFRMKCHLCDNYIEMETDPKNFDYTIVSGARRKNQKWDMAENEQVLTEDREAVKKLARDAMYRLEHGVDDTRKLKKAAPSLTQIAEIQAAKKDDYSQNQILRKKFRGEKQQLLAVETSDKALLAKSSLDIDLVPESEQDKKLASLLKFTSTETYEEKRQQKRTEIQNRDIFASTSTSSPPTAESTPSSCSTSSTSSSSAAERHSEAQKTLMTQVLKKKGPGVFGAFDSKANSSTGSSSTKRTAKMLIGGTKALVVTKKRKRSDDFPERQVEKRARHLTDGQVMDGKSAVETPVNTTSKAGDRTKDGSDKHEGTLDSTLSSSSAVSGVPVESSIPLKSETERRQELKDRACSSKSREAAPSGQCSHLGFHVCDSAQVANASSHCLKDRTSDITNPAYESGSTNNNQSTQSSPENETGSASAVLPEDEPSSSGTAGETQENAKCEQSSLSLVSYYSSSSESEGEQ